MTPTILVHGGAGLARADDDVPAIEGGCLRAARAGDAVLRAGGSALDAVEAAVVALEDDPLFNAGTGACLTLGGQVELDASLMDGRDLRCGAVALVRTVKNPIRLARAVMERTSHVFLVADGAEALADEAGLVRVPNQALITGRAQERWRQALASRQQPVSGGTVGAVAIDGQGHVAAATSTGGMILKREGRVGDSPLIGAGTYADDEAGAASATGHGEAIIRVTLTRAACDRLRAGAPAEVAARQAIEALARVRGEAGVIVVDRHGRLGAAFNTQRMARAWVSAGGEGAAYRGPGPVG